MNPEEIQEKLADLPIPAIRYFTTIGSTNDEALSWIHTGVEDSSLVVADQQIHGRGRLNRHWITNPGAAIAFSLILKPAVIERDHLALFSPLAGVALHQTLIDLFSLPAEIKWPNDVLIRRKKVAGILTEAHWTGSQLEGVVIGVGINIAPSSVPPPGEALFPPTCIEAEYGKPVDRLSVLQSVLEDIFSWRTRLSSPAFFQYWESHLAFLQEGVRIESGNGDVYNGKVLGIDPSGNLRLLATTGEEKSIAVGDVRLRPAEETDRPAFGGA